MTSKKNIQLLVAIIFNKRSENSNIFWAKTWCQKNKGCTEDKTKMNQPKPLQVCKSHQLRITSLGTSMVAATTEQQRHNRYVTALPELSPPEDAC